MVEVDECFGLPYNFSSKEGEKYLGKPMGEVLEEYVQNLEKATRIK